jgi:hypothetical protein
MAVDQAMSGLGARLTVDRQGAIGEIYAALGSTVRPDDFHDGVEALLCHCELQEHAPDLLASTRVGEAEEGRAVVSTINRNTGTHQPESTRQASTGRAQTSMQGSCQRFARNYATRNLTSPHDPSVGSVFHLRGCAGT